MQNLVSVWQSLDTRRRVIAILATVAVFASVLLISRMASAPSMALLYAGLEPTVAGEVVQALEKRGAHYEVRGSSIFVASGQRDELRVTLASDGLPAAGAAGYEILDSLSGFGTTAQMFDAAYWRAKEGELARTILASPLVRAARVHLSNPNAQPFRRRSSASASVFITPAAGTLDKGQARAFAHLVASAVAGLAVKDVSVIDALTGQVIGTEDQMAGLAAGRDREAVLRGNVERLLAAHVGPGKAVVEVSLETNLSSEAITERRFDPENRVAISTDTEQSSDSSKGNGANVTVASNLPDGDANAEGGSSSESTNSRERVNFEVSETQREVLRQPGEVTRLTVAVLVDGRQTIDANGERTWVERPAEELEALRELVASAVGFNESRGDVITLKSLEFIPVEVVGTAAGRGFVESLELDVMQLIQLAVLTFVVLALSLFVLRPILLRPTTQAASLAPVAQGLGADGLLEGDLDAGELGGGSEPDALAGPSTVEDFDFSIGNAMDSNDMLPDLSVATEDPVSRLKRAINEREGETIKLLKSWMDDERQSV